MKRLRIVTSVMTQIKLPESRLENYFNSNSKGTKQLRDNFCGDFENIDWLSAHAAARASVQMVFASDESSVVICVDIPTTAHFLVTGIKTFKESYKLAFAVSMS
jgi:hypothetical protein